MNAFETAHAALAAAGYTFVMANAAAGLMVLRTPAGKHGGTVGAFRDGAVVAKGADRHVGRILREAGLAPKVARK